MQNSKLGLDFTKVAHAKDPSLPPRKSAKALRTRQTRAGPILPTWTATRCTTTITTFPWALPTTTM